MYSTLPKSLTMELAVKTKIEDPTVVEERRKLTSEQTPMELGNIGSISDLPIPTPISNLFNRTTEAETPVKPKRRNMEEKRKRNLTTGTFLAADYLPLAWTETKLVCRTKVEEDPEVLKSRQELVAGKSVSELGQIHGFEDLPVPSRLQTLIKKKRVLKSTEEKEGVRSRGRSLTSLSSHSLTSFSMPEALKTPLAVKAVVEDPELVARNKEIIKTKSVGELAHIGALSDLPIPDNIEKLYKKITTQTERSVEPPPERSGAATPASFKETIYDTLPRSLRETKLMVKSKFEEDEEKLKERQELTRTKSPTELSQISSMSDFPIPTPVENLLSKKSEQTEGESPMPPPRKWKKEDIYESLPASLTQELVVRSREMEDPEELEARRELIRTQSPAQLSQICSLQDIPVPTFIENLMAKKDTAETTTEKEKADDEEKSEKGPFKIYDTLPSSLKDTKLMVKSVVEEPEVQARRMEVVKSKSVAELSQVASLSDFPVPDTIENFVKTLDRKQYGPAERRKKIKEQTKSKSTQSLSQGMYASLPRSLKQELAVKTVEQDPDLVAERKEILASKSVSELSKVTSLADVPIPSAIRAAFHKSMEKLSSLGPGSSSAPEDESSRPVTPGSRSVHDNIYATLPKSLKAELLVTSCVEDPELVASRMEITTSKSVSELSQIRSLSDFPIPENIEKLMTRAATNTAEPTEEAAEQRKEKTDDEETAEKGPFKIYDTLPSSLKDTKLVCKTLVEEPEVQAVRAEVVKSKSVNELSQISTLSDFPIPDTIENFVKTLDKKQYGPAERRKKIKEQTK